VKDLFEVPKLTPTQARCRRMIKRWTRLLEAKRSELGEILLLNWNRSHPELRSDFMSFINMATNGLALYHVLIPALLEQRLPRRARAQCMIVLGFDTLFGIASPTDNIDVKECGRLAREIAGRIISRDIKIEELNLKVIGEN